MKRKEELLDEARYLLEFIKKRYNRYEDPLSNPAVIADCIKKGYLDAVHILKNEKFQGTLNTKLVDGKCVAYDKATGKILNEEERLKKQEIYIESLKRRAV